MIKDIKYFDKPAQVKFYDEDGVYGYGIAYRDEIICGCCGGIFEINDVINAAQEDGVMPIEVLEWIPLDEEIKGDC